MDMELNGLYRAYVTNVSDPDNRGRIRVNCPNLGREYQSAWCNPCFPCDGDFYLPAVGSCVWVIFNQNDLSKPVWLGGWYTSGSAPSAGQRLISYGGAVICLKNGAVYVNGMDVKNEINKLWAAIAALGSS